MTSPTPLVLILILGTSIALLVTAPAQEPPSRPASGQQEPAEGGDEKVHANPLDDPGMSQKAKLGKFLAKKRCVICHKIEGKGGVLSPPMEQVTADRFTKMETYDRHIADLKAKDPARYRASKKVFEAIAAEENRYQKLILWLKAYIDKPTFDNGQAKMTKQILKPSEVEQIIAYLLTLEPKEEEEEEKD